MATVIEPTIGRVVLFHPAEDDAQLADQYRGQSFAAIICDVHDSCLLNLIVFAKNGYPHARVNVPLLQGDGVADERVAYAHWMPYQLGQAARTEAAERLMRS